VITGDASIDGPALANNGDREEAAKTKKEQRCTVIKPANWAAPPAVRFIRNQAG
jgi:hypothetical protein